MKVAFSGSSGSGKTTLVKFVEKELGLKHISGSAGDILRPIQKKDLEYLHGYTGGNGHKGVIIKSIKNPQFGFDYQNAILISRSKAIEGNDDFVTDRSPVDNLTYFISQVGFNFNDDVSSRFAYRCLEAYHGLTHLIYVKAVQPNEVENNGSRIPNKWWQQASDAQFEHWLKNYFMIWRLSLNGFEVRKPKVLIIDFWDLEQRKEKVLNFLKQ